MLVGFTNLKTKFPIQLKAELVCMIQPIHNSVLGSMITLNMMSPGGYISFEVIESVDECGEKVNQALSGQVLVGPLT